MTTPFFSHAARPPQSSDRRRLALAAGRLWSALVAGRAAAAVRVLAALLALGIWASTPSLASAQTLEVSAQADVPVLGDNLDQAKTRALREAQVQVLQNGLEALVAPEWRAAYDRDLRRRIYPRLDRYLTSFRTTRSEPSADRTHYIAAITAQLARAPLAEDLRDMQLPVIGDPKRTVRVLYAADDPVLANPQARQDALALLQPRLDLLNFAVIGASAVSPDEAALLREPGETPRRAALLKRQRAEADLYLQFRTGAAPSATTPSARESVATATLFHGELGGVMGTFDARAVLGTTGKARDPIAALIPPLAGQMQPAALQPLSAFAAAAAQLDLRIRGLRSIEDEEAFGAAFFRRSSPFGAFILSRVESDAIVYRGSYAANRQSAERELLGHTFGPFTVRQVNWIDSALELEVRGEPPVTHRELDGFPTDARPQLVQDTLTAFLSKGNTPDLGDPVYAEHEDNGWLDRANALAFNAPIYGLVDARADSDFYVAEALAEGEVIEIVWARLDRTNLVPVLRLYDEKGLPVRTVVPRLYSRISYKVPEGQHGFYVEVADRFGFIQGESGGYLKFPYLLTVRRQSQR
jgi:hypothetical protein